MSTRSKLPVVLDSVVAVSAFLTEVSMEQSQIGLKERPTFL